MKSININDINLLPGKRITVGEKFTFRCHSGLSCFNQCCRNLNLFLYPYDVLRLKNKLKISSEAFIDSYVDVVMKPDSFFPELLLKMTENKEKTCPFLTEKGCSIYLDRPDTCRTFPVEHGLLFHQPEKNPESIHFFRPPDFCMGQYEPDAMDVESWAINQNALVYNDMTARWAAVKAHFYKNPWGSEGFSGGPKGKMAFMAAYNMERFQEFIFNSTFLNRYRVKPAYLKKIKQNETELLKFGFKWISFFVCGITSADIAIN